MEQLIRNAESTPAFCRMVSDSYIPTAIRRAPRCRMADADGKGDHLLLSIPVFQAYETGATWSSRNDVVAVPLQLIGQQSRYLRCVISLRNPRATELFSWNGAIGRPRWLGSVKELLVTPEACDVSSMSTLHRAGIQRAASPSRETRSFYQALTASGVETLAQHKRVLKAAT